MHAENKRIERLVNWLEDTGFTLKERTIGDAFGDGLVVLECPDLAVRLVRDRGEQSIELRAPQSNSWRDISTWRAVLEGNSVEEEPRSLEDRIVFLQNRLFDLRLLASSPQLDEQLRQRALARMSRRFPRWFGSASDR